MSSLAYSGPYDYDINRHGDKYVATPRHGFDYIKDTSLSTVWLAINAELGRGPAVKFGASTATTPFVVDATLETEYQGTIISGLGPERSILMLDDSVDDDMIRNTNSEFHRNTRVESICLDGNRTGNAAGRGLEFAVGAATGGTEQFYEWVTLDNIIITECDQEGLYMQSTSNVLATLNMDNFRIWDCDGDASGYQISLDRIFDGWIGGTKSSVSSMRMKTCSSMHVHNLYFGGGVDNLLQIDGGDANYNATGNIFTNCRVDNALGTAVLLDDYACRNMFMGCEFTNMSQSAATNTYPCVEAAGNARYNFFNGCYFGHNNIITDDRWTYAYADSGSADYNHLIGCISGYGAVLGGNAEHFTVDEENAAANTIIKECYKNSGAAWNA